jgi:hypothetical protein
MSLAQKQNVVCQEDNLSFKIKKKNTGVSWYTVCPFSNQTLFELDGTFFENKMERSTN